MRSVAALWFSCRNILCMCSQRAKAIQLAARVNKSGGKNSKFYSTIPDLASTFGIHTSCRLRRFSFREIECPLRICHDAI